MGDGGFIAQITNQSTGQVTLATNSNWKCLTIHEAPLNKDCESSSDPASDCQSNITAEPEGWKDRDFDDSSWPNATQHSAADVSPKGGYDDISWDNSATLIWGADLETHNTLLCRITLP